MKNEEQRGDEIIVLTTEQSRLAEISSAYPVLRSMSGELKINGSVDVPPQNIVSVSFPLGGYLRSTKLLPGMEIKKGDVLAIMEDQALIQLQQEYLVTAAKLKYLQQEYERQKSLSENKVSAEKVYQQTSSEYTSQKVILKGYAEKLKLIGINPEGLSERNLSKSVALRSPINGFVSKVNVNIGKYVTGTDVLFELINPDDLHASLMVFEKDIAKINIGQKVDVKFIDDTSRVYPCEIILVTKNVDEGRAAQVHCHFETQPDHLLPGMFLTASVKTNTAEVVCLPENSVVRFGNREYVFEEVEAKKYKMIPVVTGTTDQGFIEIVKPDPGFEKRKFVVNNAYALLSRQKNASGE